MKSLKPMLEFESMAMLTVRNLSDEVHRALRMRAVLNDRSTEAEVRDILEKAVKPEGNMKLGSYLAGLARETGGLTDEEHALIGSARIKSQARAVSFE